MESSSNETKDIIQGYSNTLIRIHKVTITTLQCAWSIPLSFCFAFHITGPQHPGGGGGVRGLQPPSNFQTQLNFEKIYYKCIPLCSCVCFELSFKAPESLKLLIPFCRALHLVKTFLNIGTTFAAKIYSRLQPLQWEK